METIIKGVTITDPNGPHDGTTKDVLVRDGVIVDIQDAISSSSEATKWNEPGAHLSIGWMDLQADFADPGYCLLYTSPSPRDGLLSRMPSSA